MKEFNFRTENALEDQIEQGKNPGLGIRELHRQGIDGSGVNVAIIDQKLNPEHEEFSDNVSRYIEIESSKEEPTSMHGPAVSSLLVGKTCGVAPESKLFYFATPSGRDFTFKAQAIKQIIEENKKRIQEQKIRIISSSVGYREDFEESGLQEYIDAIKEAEDSGIIFVDVSNIRESINFLGCGSQTNKDDPETYEMCKFVKPEFVETGKQRILIPCDNRTFASNQSDSSYTFEETGAISWSVPFLAGIIALMLQIDPNLKKDEISKIINETAYTNAKGFKIINPKKIIEYLKQSQIY
jgi:serine protease AprX